MTGTRQLAYQIEPANDYAGSPSGSDYLVPFKNPTIEDIELSNALQRMRLPDDPQAVESVAMRFEGAFGVSGVLTEPWWLTSHFGTAPGAGGETSAPYTYTWDYTDHTIRSSRWYVGVQSTTGEIERELKGVVLGQVEFSISEGEPVNVTLTGFYGDESGNGSLSPGTLVGADADPMLFHGGSISVPASSEVAMPQSATLSLNSSARAMREWERKPVDAAIGNVETTLSLSNIIRGTDTRSLAYGNSSAPVTSSGVSGAADGTLQFTGAGSEALTLNLTRVKHNTYNWSQVLDRNSDTLEDSEFFVDKVSATAESSRSEAPI